MSMFAESSTDAEGCVQAKTWQPADEKRQQDKIGRVERSFSLPEILQ